jgi:Metallo-peptidase family M12B Reprolysin-like
MASLRALSNCIGLSGQISMARDFYGFARGQLPPDPTGATVSLSFKRQAQRLQGRHFHLNVIAVGSDQFTDGDYIEIDYSIFKLRNIYDQVALGVGRIEHWIVLTADADGLDTPTSRGDLEDITHHWTVDNDGLDIFMPHNMSVPSGTGQVLGNSPEGGPCDKNDKDMNGSTAGLWVGDQTARSFAHEIGHYLGLGHENGTPTNLMCQSGMASSVRNSTLLNTDQGDAVRGHCFVHDGC